MVSIYWEAEKTSDGLLSSGRRVGSKWERLWGHAIKLFPRATRTSLLQVVTSMRKLLIGCGYLGERVAREWLRQGDEVWVLTRSTANAERFASLGLKPVIGDVLDPESLEKLPGAESVLYAVGFDRSAQASKRTVYVDGLSNVLSKIGSKCERFLYVSSTSVYGQDAGELVDESSLTRPKEENGCVCRDAEAVARQVKSTAIVLRLAGIYGPGRLLARVEQLRRGDRLSGNPNAWLNLIHVDDAVRAVLAAETRGVSGATYLVCDDLPPRRHEYYSALAQMVGAPVPKFEELAADAPERQRLNKRCVNRRLREELRVELQFPTINDGLRSSLEATR